MLRTELGSGLLLALLLGVLASCGTVQTHRQFEQALGSQLVVSVGGVIVRMNKIGDLPNAFDGRDKIMEFLTGALGRSSMLTAHHGHHPEIELTSETTATGVWALWDTVIDTQHGITIRGAAFYRDEYVKVDGAWKFRSTGYERTYEEMEPYPADGPVRLTANRFADGPEGA